MSDNNCNLDTYSFFPEDIDFNLLDNNLESLFEGFDEGKFYLILIV